MAKIATLQAMNGCFTSLWALAIFFSVSGVLVMALSNVVHLQGAARGA